MSEGYLESYTKAINKIEDYFEYRNESMKDREVVHAILATLAEDMENLAYTKDAWKELV